MNTAPNGSTPAIMVLQEKTRVFIPLIHTTNNLYKSAHQKKNDAKHYEKILSPENQSQGQDLNGGATKHKAVF